MKGKPDCGACIEEFGQRHTLSRLAYAYGHDGVVFLCDYHDSPGTDTLASLGFPTALDGRGTE